MATSVDAVAQRMSQRLSLHLVSHLSAVAATGNSHGKVSLCVRCHSSTVTSSGCSSLPLLAS